MARSCVSSDVDGFDSLVIFLTGQLTTLIVAHCTLYISEIIVAICHFIFESQEVFKTLAVLQLFDQLPN